MKLALRCAAATLCLLFSSVPAWSATTAELEEFRADFGRFLDELSALGPQARRLNERAMAPVFESLEQARLKLAEADEQALLQLRDAMDVNPDAWEVPAQLASRMALVTKAAGTVRGVKADTATCADDSGQEGNCASCPAGTNLGVKDEIIMAGVVLALEQVWAIIPEGNDIPIPIIGGSIRIPNIAKVIIGIALYALKTIELGIATANEYHDSCEDNYRDRVSNFNLDDTVTSRASAAAVANLASSIAAYEAEALRFDIEANMVGETSKTAISSFQLPSRRGGHLETVRAICLEAIDKLAAPGDHMAEARRYLGIADVNYGLEKWVEAYEAYRAAYRIAVSDDPTMARRRLR